MLFNGLGCVRDVNHAFKMFKKGADNNDLKGKFYLGRID